VVSNESLREESRRMNRFERFRRAAVVVKERREKLRKINEFQIILYADAVRVRENVPEF
jgi:hypothetical protein